MTKSVLYSLALIYILSSCEQCGNGSPKENIQLFFDINPSRVVIHTPIVFCQDQYETTNILSTGWKHINEDLLSIEILRDSANSKFYIPIIPGEILYIYIYDEGDNTALLWPSNSVDIIEEMGITIVYESNYLECP